MMMMKVMCSKVNATAKLEFELAYNDVSDLYISHNITGTP